MGLVLARPVEYIASPLDDCVRVRTAEDSSAGGTISATNEGGYLAL